MLGIGITLLVVGAIVAVASFAGMMNAMRKNAADIDVGPDAPPSLAEVFEQHDGWFGKHVKWMLVMAAGGMMSVCGTIMIATHIILRFLPAG